MAVVKVENKSYTVEPLYQWDQNQDLEIRGLSLPVVPEIHFATMAMSRAIVRQASMDAAGVLRVDVPNSLLQKPYTIKVYICTYTGDTFETLYKLEIPVKERTKPADYTLEDDPEVYSFNALENQLVNTLQVVETDYAAATTAMNTARTAYTNATAQQQDAAARLASAEAAYTNATAQQQDAAEKYQNALETLGGVDDGTVFVKRSGDSMQGALDMGGNALTGLPAPVNGSDAVTKEHLEGYKSPFVGFDLLWQNSGNSLGAETLDLDLSGYSLILVRWIVSLNADATKVRYQETVHPVGGGGISEAFNVSMDGTWKRRTLTVTTTGIEFSLGYSYPIGDDTGAPNASYFPPKVIYGIKL